MEKRTNPPDKGYWSDKGSSMSVRCGRSDSKWMDKNFVEDFEPNSSDEDYVDQIFRRKPKGLLPWWNGDYTAQRDTARGDCYGLLVRLWCLYFVFLGPWFVMFLTVKTIPGQAFVCAALTETKVEKSKESFVTKDRDVHLCGTEDER
ncbi:unnamed protein product [Ilex paraguariensis]|uniref:Uncharacterized protein n=1 Tax=Ilex paraguariensis TaxID=185542 RepID=A0ABC8UV52_9AQUA